MSAIFRLNLENRKVFHFVMIALLLSVEVTLHYLEFFISVPVGGYLLKIGVSNIVVLSALYLFGEVDGLFLAFAKIPLAMLLEPQVTLITLSISFGGTIFSVISMIIFKNIVRTKIITTSCVGGIFHNIGQLLAVIIIVRVYILIWYLPFLVVVGIITGYLVGKLSSFLVNKLNLLTHK